MSFSEDSESMRQNPFDLRQLIAKEDDHKMRVLLMLVNTFNDNLAANTVAVENNAKAVNGIAIKLDSHLVTFEERAARDDELRNQGKGAWRVLAWVLGVVQVAGLAIWMDSRAEIKDMHGAIVGMQQSDKVIESRITSTESRINAIEAATRTNRP